MKKTLVALFLVLILVVGILPVYAAEVPVINVVMPTIAVHTESKQDVEDAINAILVPKIGAKIHLTFTNFGDHTQQVNMMMTNPDELDLTYIYGSPRSFVESGMAYDLTEYMDSEAGQPIREIVGDSFVEAVRQNDGSIYYVPTVVDRAQETYMMVNRSIMRELGYETIDDEKIWTLDEIHDLIVSAMALHEGMYGLCGVGVKYNFDELGDSSLVGVVENRGNAEKVISITESQEFIDFAHKMREWYLEGLIMPDILSSTEDGVSMIYTGRAFGSLAAGACPNGMEGDDSWRALLSVSDQWISSEAAERQTYLMNGMTRHPDEAFKVLVEMYTNEEVKQLLSFGIKDVNYVLDDQGRAAYPDGVDSDTATYNLGFVNWFVMANGQCEVVPYTNSPDYWKLSHAYDDAAEIGGALGCVFQSENVQGQYSECSNVYSQYYEAIICGVSDPDTAIAEYSAALKAAGEDDIIAEKQRQLDEFRVTRAK